MENATTAPADNLTDTLSFKLDFDGTLTVKTITDALGGMESLIKRTPSILNKTFDCKLPATQLTVTRIESGSLIADLCTTAVKTGVKTTIENIKDMTNAKLSIICGTGLLILGGFMWSGYELAKMASGSNISGDNSSGITGNNNTNNNNTTTVNNFYGIPLPQPTTLAAELKSRFPEHPEECEKIATAITTELSPAAVKDVMQATVKLSHAGGQNVKSISLGNSADPASMSEVLPRETISKVPEKYETPKQEEKKTIFKEVLLNVTIMSKNEGGEVSFSARVEEEENIPLPTTAKKLIVDSDELQSQLFTHLARPFRATVYAVYIRDAKGNPDYQRYILKSID